MILYIYDIYSIGGDKLDIILSNASPKPIYEQIAQQIKAQVISGGLKQGEMLPSMRQLARDLRISVITTKRAYEELEQAGFIETVAGKGCFVAGANTQVLRNEHMERLREHLSAAIETAQTGNIPREELEMELNRLWPVDRAYDTKQSEE